MNKKVLYVDDEDINLMIFSRLFEKDFVVQTYNSPKKALQFLKENKVDLILTDQQMPIMLGTEMLDSIAQLFPVERPKIAIVSGYNKNSEITDALNKKLADTFISKPWEYDSLKSTLIQLMND